MPRISTQLVWGTCSPAACKCLAKMVPALAVSGEGVTEVLSRGGRGSLSLLSFVAPALELFSAEGEGVAPSGLTEEKGRFTPSEFRFDLKVDVAR